MDCVKMINTIEECLPFLKEIASLCGEELASTIDVKIKDGGDLLITIKDRPTAEARKDRFIADFKQTLHRLVEKGQPLKFENIGREMGIGSERQRVKVLRPTYGNSLTKRARSYGIPSEELHSYIECVRRGVKNYG